MIINLISLKFSSYSSQTLNIFDIVAILHTGQTAMKFENAYPLQSLFDHRFRTHYLLNERTFCQQEYSIE